MIEIGEGLTEDQREWSRTIHAKLAKEAKEGGELTELPCPMCGRPRSQRSDYVRCTPCGLNWLEGEDLGHNPKVERWAQFLESVRSPSTKSSRTGPGGTA